MALTEVQENSAPIVRVRRRQVIHFGGFEPVSPEALDRRLASAMERFPPLWNIRAAKSAPSLSADGVAMAWDVTAGGPDWETATRYTVLRWDTIIERYTRGPWPKRMVKGYAALLGYLFTGTIRRFFRLARRYGLFSIYPLVALVLALLLGWLVAAIAYGVGVPQGPAWLVGLVAVVALLYRVGNFIYLDFALDHWKFASDLARRRVAGLDAMLDRVSGELASIIRGATDDEIVISGISLGSVMATETLARALSRDPELLRDRRVALLTTGSSFLQVGLHPAAAAHRAAVARVAAEPGLLWLEVQATTDPVNFANTDPVTDLGLAATGRPTVRVFRLRDLMSEEAYRRIRRDHMRLHRHYVMPNGLRHYYDYYMICFGPLALESRAQLAEGTLELFGADGGFRPAGSGQ